MIVALHCESVTIYYVILLSLFPFSSLEISIARLRKVEDNSLQPSQNLKVSFPALGFLQIDLEN